ncbi:ANKL1 protein, partial [Eubucco bourcierii]|nr:ANKL1 protein [Eubucco bourcierii]
PDSDGARCSLSFLTEDGTDASIFPTDGLLSSTRRSLLEGLEDDCGLGDPPALSIPSFTPWPYTDPGGLLQPLASSTLLGDGPGEGPPRSWAMGERKGPPWPHPGASSVPSSQQDSTPSVLLIPRGHHPHPQDSPSDAQGSSSSTPPALLDPGDHHPHPQDSPSDAQGSPNSTPPAPLDPRDHHPHPQDSPSDAQGSPNSTPPAPLDPRDHHPHPQDSPSDAQGSSTRARQGGHSPELEAALRTGQVPDCTQDELVLAQQFDHPDRSWHWREGLAKSSFNYLLLDPRTTQNLPLRSHCLSPAECFKTFIKAIFYVGKGTRARPYCHLTAALSQHRAGTQRGCPKVRRILEIWASGQGVVSLHCFHNSVPAEAYTRESCLVEALGLQTITNQRQGHSYGAAARWAGERRRRLGVHLLHRAMRIFLAEGERQLRPADIQGGR